MFVIGWKFPPRGGGPEQGYTNQGIEAFRGGEIIDNLAREICQNSLDARKNCAVGPVRVEFRLEKLTKSKYNLFSEYAVCIEGCKLYWKKKMDEKLKIFLSGVDEVLNGEEISILIASDYNTTGLTGSKAPKEDKSVWRGLVESEGTSVKNGDSAGSYGVGKNAPFACSSLSMVLYNTVAIDHEKAFQGVALIATLLQNGKDTQRVGHYKVIDGEDGHPVYAGDSDCSIRDFFHRTEIGTDVGIVGFNESVQWEEKIEKAILKHFFMAIYENKLAVKIGSTLISKDNLQKTFEKYCKNDSKVGIAYEMYLAVISPENGVPYKNSILSKDDIEFYLKIDNSYSRNIGNFRNSGMLVGRSVRKTLQRFSGVIVVRGQQLGELLKDTEPARHNKWDYTIIPQSNKEHRKKAKSAIDSINQWINDILKSRFEITTQKMVDSDMGEYLPAEIGDANEMGGEAQGTDKLKMNQKISESKPILTISKSLEAAEKTKGKKVKGRSGQPINPFPHIPPIPPIPPIERTVTVNPREDGGKSGIGKDPGKKTISYPTIIGQRTIPRNISRGIYSIKIKAEKSSDTIYLQFASVGEDTKQDNLKVLTYVSNGKKKENIYVDKIGPIQVQADKFEDVSVIFDCHEKVLISMTVTDER